MDTKVGVGDRSLTPYHTHGYIWLHSCSRIFGKLLGDGKVDMDGKRAFSQCNKTSR
jgi:hypothetical protein